MIRTPDHVATAFARTASKLRSSSSSSASVNNPSGPPGVRSSTNDGNLQAVGSDPAVGYRTSERQEKAAHTRHG